MDTTNTGSDNNSSIISLHDVTLRLGEELAFTDTDWTVYEGQQWAILGPNGSGKSLLVQALRGSVPLAHGKITYNLPPRATPGSVSTGAQPRDRVVYVSFDAQRSALYRRETFHQLRWNTGVGSGSGGGSDTLTAAEFLSADRISGRNPYEVSADISGDTSSDVVGDAPGIAGFEELRRQVAERLQIVSLLERRLIQLSNGEMRKVLIAQALLRRPQLLILDNPFAGLDQAFRERLKGLIQSLIESDTRLIVVTGRPDEIPPGITHVLLVAGQRIIHQGPRDAVLNSAAARKMFIAEAEARAAVQVACGGKSAPRFTAGTSDDGEILVEMRNVSVAYGRAEVLKNLDWTVRKGQNWALLGPNGAGKTTLLSLIIGDHPQAYANDITLFGRRRGSGESIWEIKEHIGWVSSELHLYYPPQTSIIDTVCSGFFDAVGLFRDCTPPQIEAARIWLARLGIHQPPADPFGALSHGEQRLVLAARALVKQPDLLILDEPCQGLDSHNRRSLVRIVDEAVTHLDAGLIYVTHDHDQLPTCITHILRLT